MMKKQELTPKEITHIIRSYRDEYSKKSKLEKERTLDHLEIVTGRPRKSIIRTLNHQLQSFSTETFAKGQSILGARGRPVIYTPAVTKALEAIWLAYNCPCAERLYPEIASAVKIFQRDGEWHYSEETTSLLQAMSMSAMRTRLVGLARQHHLERGISATRSSSLKALVPTFHGSWQEMPVGYGQIDTVVHSGGELLAPMAYTVNFVDMQTYWQEMVAQLNKTASTTLASIKLIEERLPFPLVGLHPDSGDEFLNWLLFEWCRDRTIHYSGYYGGKIDLTRSRPSKKNDNCSVEERNGNIIRKYVGYERYDCQEAVDVVNELYSVLRLYVNYFQPVQKLICKERQVSGRYKRIYGPAQTPYRRVLDRPDIADDIKERLRAEYETLSPKHLLARIKALTIKLQKAQQEQGYHG